MIPRQLPLLAVLAGLGAAPLPPLRAQETPELLSTCLSGDTPSCVLVAPRLASGSGIEADPERAARLLLLACDLENGSGCAELGRWYGRGLHVNSDASRAIALYRRGCELGDGGACN